MIRYTRRPSPLGELLLTDHGGGLSGILFSTGNEERGKADWVRDDEWFAEVDRQLDAYFAGELVAFDISIDLRGTPFQQSVWAALREVPYGATTTYGRLAAVLGRPTASRAVAGAIGRNPVPIVVGCHRVVGADGNLTGFSGGLDRKRWLLDLESSPVPAVVGQG